MDEVRLNILKAQLNTLRQVNPIRAMEIQKSIQNELSKEVNPLLNLEKSGGEGSKGGKVIGHTKSGKPIYANAKHASHANFTPADHKDAYHLHRDKAKEAYSARQESQNKRATYDKDEYGQTKNYKLRDASASEKETEDKHTSDYNEHSAAEFHHAKQFKKKSGIKSSHNLSLED